MLNSLMKSVIYAGVSLDIITVSSIIIGFTILYFYYSRLRKVNTRLQYNDNLERLLEKFQPEALVGNENNVESDLYLQPNVVTNKIGTKIHVNNQEYVNFASHNYLNLVSNKKISDEAIDTIKKYGVGSCGPRGFYGTVDVHLDLEERIAQFMNMEEAAVYSYGFSTVASAIPAYCKRNDAVFCDEMISFAAKKGMDAAKCTIIYFKHNDAEDLEHKIAEFDKNTAHKKVAPRKFLVLEGIYYNTGTICDLRSIIKLRSKNKMRLFLDESLSIGVLGKTGRGITEHFSIDIAEVDMIIGSLEGLIGSIGGFCVGSHFIIEHQRLSGLGYCFSASLPPVLTRAAYCAFDYIDENSPRICLQLREKCVQMHSMLETISNMKVISSQLSPLKYLQFEKEANEDIYKKFVKICQEKGVIVSLIKNTSNEEWQIKVCINIEISIEDKLKAIAGMNNAATECALH